MFTNILKTEFPRTDNGFAESEGMRNLKYLLGIDLGTSGTKTVLFEETGRSVASETIEYPLYQPKNGWAEQEPEDWWNAARDTVKAVIAKSGVKPEDVKGVGISGQMHGLVMLNEKGEVIRKMPEDQLLSVLREELLNWEKKQES